MIICYANHKEELGYSSLIDTAIIQNSYKLEDIDLLLNNVDLRSYRFKYEKEGFYQQIIRISFWNNLASVTFELGLTYQNTFDLVIKYGEGDTIKFNGFPCVASIRKSLLFKNIKNSEQISIAKEIFKLASNFTPVNNIPSSCIYHIVEYRDDSENGDNYYRFKIWCQPKSKDQLALITSFYLLTFILLKEKNNELLFLAQWEDMIVKWNSGKVRRFLTN
jgi:hypothetical protein